MADPNLVDFYANVARFEKARAKGYGFEAAGTLGRSYYNRSQKKRRNLLAPLLLVVCCGIGLKAAIYQSVGAASYDARVQSLLEGQGFDRLGGWLMQADPVTVLVADQIAKGMTHLK